MKLKQFIFAFMAMLLGFVSPSFAQNVAKVGNTEYNTIDEAIDNWDNGETLTLLGDVTLSDVIKLKSTEHHILDLGTYTMTAASGKDAIVIQACGTGSAERTAITINAAATNPGGINAGSKCVVYYKYADGGISTEDRPIIKINGGVFTGSTSSWGTAGIYTIGTAARKCATLNISGGTFNCTINGSGKSKLIITGGVFNYSVGSQGDSTALRLISGGKFKTLGFMTADSNNTKFWFGTAMAKSDVGIYVDDEGYLCVGGPVITEVGPKYKAVAKNATKWSSYLAYSSAATYGLYYTNAEAAIKKHGAANVTVWEKPAITIPEDVTGDATVVEEIKNNTALKDYTPTNLPAGAELEIELKSVGSTIIYDVTPMADGTKVNPTQAITFRLPVPASVTKTYAKVYHENEFMGVFAIQGEGNAKYVELTSQSFSEYSIEPITPVAKIDESLYPTLSEAFAAVTDDAQTVVVLTDVTENLTSSLRGNITTEKGAKVTITLANSDWLYCPYTFILGENVTLKVPAFFYYAGGTQINGTLVVDAYYQRYGGTKLTINEPGSMTVTGETCIIRYVEGDPDAGIYINGDNNPETVGLKLSVAYFYQGLINAKNANIQAGVYWQTNETDGQGSANLFLDNSTLNVTVNEQDFKATGNSTVTLQNNSSINVAGSFDAGDNTTLNVDATSAINDKNGVVAIPAAKIGTIKYATLDEAFAAATEGQTITLLADATPALTSQRAITKAAVIDLDGKTLTLTEDDLYFGTTTFKNGTIVVDPSVKPSTAVFWMFANQTLTFDNVKIVATGVTGTYLIGLEGENSDLNLLNGSEILVENTSALDLDIICVNGTNTCDIKVENSKVNVKNLDGRVFFRGNYTVKDSEVNLAGITKAGFRIEAGQTLSIEGTSKVTIEGEPRDGGIHLTDATATYTKAETATVNATVNRPSVVQIGENKYPFLAEAVANAKAGDEIVMLADVTLDAATTLPAGIIFNGNGKQINGTIIAGGEITFAGVTKVVSFNVKNTNTVVNIPAGASLQLTGTGRMVIGHGCTFNITGTITDAKSADKTTLTPSLVMPGASFTGAGVTFNVTNAYIKTTASYCSSSKSASGTFDFNINNSIWEQFGKLAFESQSTAAKVDFALVNSVLTTTSHLVFATASGEEGVVIDNSLVNQGISYQIENRGTMTIKNGAVVNGAVATSSNAINPGTIIVENATYAVTGELSGAAVGTGTLIIKKGATVSVGSIKAGANVTVDAEGMAAGDEINFTANLSQFTGTLSVINNDKLEAKIVDGKIVLVAKPVAKIGEQGYETLEAAFKAATSGCTIDILSDVTVDSKWDCRYTGAKFTVPVTINGNSKTIKFTGSVNDNNWNTVFRFEDNAAVNNLTVDISNATDAQRVISAKKSLNVDGLNIVGAARYGVIYGEGASATDLAATEIVVKNSTLGATRRAVSDNEGGKDVKSVVIEGNTFNANVYVSASESIAFNNNTVNGETDLRSYAADNVLNVQAQDNTLATDKKNYIYAKTIVAQEGFETKNPPLKVATKAELNTALAAAKEGDVITLTADIDYGTDQLAIAKAITLDLGDKTLTTRNAWGGMSIKGNPTVKNGTIVHASNTAAIKVWNATAFEDLVIDVQGKGDANKTIGGIVLQSGSTTRVGSIKNVTIKGAALTNGIETYNCGDATENVIGAMENVTIDAQGTGMLISAPCGTATNCNIKGGTNGIEIWIKGNYSASLDLVDSNIDGGVYAHDEFSSYPDVVNNGTLKFTADEQTTGAKAENVTLTIARAEKVEGVLKEVKDNAIAKGKNTYYATLEEAIKAAAPAGTVELLKDVTVDKWITISETLTIGDGTVITLPMNGLTIDGQNHTLTIKEVVSPEREDFLFHNATNLNVKNLTISCVGSDVYDGGISLMSGRIENVTFNGSKYGVLPGANGVTVTGCTFNGTTGYAIYYEEAREGIVVTGNTFNTADGAYAITMRSNEQFTNNTIIKGKVNIANSSSANVTGNNFGTERFKVYNAATATIKENTINNLVFNDNSAVNSTFAENTLSAEAQAVLDASKAYGKQAKIGGTYYATIADAITAAQAGEIVTILAGTYKVPQMKAGITVVGEGEVLLEGTLSGTLENLTLKNLHIKGGNAQRWAYAKGDLVFENVTFEATSVYALHFDGIAEGTNLTYKNCTIIGWAAMGGSPASCVFDGCTIKGNGTYGVIRTYFDATIKDCTLDVANVNTNDAYQDGIHAVEGAKVTVTNSTNVNGDIKDLVNIHGASVVTVDGVAYKNVVKVDDNYYATLAEAFAEIGDGTDKTVELIADVDLAGAEWTPITFNGVFDGKNHTISNLVVNGAGKSNQGFFAQTNNGEIKNVTFNNAKITGRLNVGVVAGTPYTSKYTNVKVTGHVEVNGMAYVGGVGGKNAYADWTDITVDVDETSYVKATSTENGKAYRTYVGGVIGFNGEGGHTFKNISSNIKVIGDVMDIGGIFGILHYGNNAENITFTGAVEAPAGATEVGSIAGVWHNEKGQTVTITNATSEGTVKVGDVTTTGSLVGGAYNAENQSPETSGSLIIDGKEAWVGIAKIGDKPYATLADAITAAQAGETITLIADVTGDVTIGKALTFEGQGKTYTGAMTLKADATFNNVNFDGKGYNGYAITTRGASYLTINGGSAKNYGYGFVQLASGTVLTTVKDVTVSNVNYGIKVDYSNAVVLENVDITAGVAALLNSNYGEKTITIKGSKLNILGTWVRNNTVKTTYVFDGANTVGQFITDASIDNFKLTAGATLTAPAGQNVTTDVADYKVIYQDGTYMAVADKVTIVDGTVQNFVNANTYEVGTLTYQRQFVDGVWNSLFVPFEIPMSALSNYDVAYINDMHSYDKDNDGVIEEFGLEVIYIKDPNATLNASHPYVIRPKNADACDMNLVLNNATLYNSTDKTEVTCSSAYMNFAFNGTYSIIPVEEGDRYYVLALDEDGNTTFGYAAPGTTLKPFRFFFTMESRGGSYVKVDDAALKTIRIYVQGEGNTTGIVDAEFNTNAADQIFDLQGRRVTTPVKGGVYIVNGKKVYINK